MLASHGHAQQDRAIPPPTHPCALSAIVWQKCISVSKARLPTKRQIERLDLKGGRLWSAALEDTVSRWEMTTALNLHTNIGSAERERDPHWPPPEPFGSNIGHSAVLTHTLSFILWKLTYILKCVHTMCTQANVVYESWVLGGAGVANASVNPCGDESKWRVTKTPQSSETPGKGRETSPNRAE